MKLIVCFLAFYCLFTVAESKAQDYLPFTEDNKTWSNALYVVEPLGEMGEGGFHYVFSSATYYCTGEADTLIDETEYSIINYCDGAYKGAIRDTEGQVFFIPKDSTDEFLLYDFTVEEGDDISAFYVEYAADAELIDGTVTEVSTVEHEGITRRVIRMDWDYYWIEGIGSTKGLFLDLQTEVSDYGRFLHCMSIDETTYYKEHEGVIEEEGTCITSLSVEDTGDAVDFSIFPNPSSNVVYCDFDADILVENISLRSIDGKECEVNWSLLNTRIEISVVDLPPGFYSLMIMSGNKTYNKPIIVQ